MSTELDQERCLRLAEIEGDHTVGAGLPDGPSTPSEEDRVSIPCRYCNAADWGMDLDGMARVMVCNNCGTRVPISQWVAAEPWPTPEPL